MTAQGSLNTANVRAGVTGAAYVAAIGSTAPTDPTTAWTNQWDNLGWVSSTGVKEAYNDTTKDIRAWQNGLLVRRMITASECTFEYTLIETKAPVLTLFHKGTTISTVSNVSTLQVVNPPEDNRMFGFDVVDGSKLLRIVVPNGEVTKRGDIIYSDEQEICYMITLTAYPDINGVVAIKYSNDSAWAAS